MADFVLDSSTALSWCFEDEATPQAYEILYRLDEESAIVPALWHLEMANILSLAVRKQRITEQRMRSFLGEVEFLPIVVDTETMSLALGDTLNLSLKHRLTAYDASYLELAQRLQIPLASKDKALCQAAKKLKLDLIEV